MKAYLLAWIDRKTERVLSCGIYSENELQVTRVNSAVPARLLECTGESFEKAIENLKFLIKTSSPYFWVQKYLA